jgi:F-type H+-transporting ATPase subunit delta
MLGVLGFLLEKNRENLVSEIIEAMLEYKRKEEGILVASVRSAAVLDEAQKGLLCSALEQASRKSVEAEFRVDPSLIGGVTVRMDDIVYDGSVSHQLHELRERFLTGS